MLAFVWAIVSRTDVRDTNCCYRDPGRPTKITMIQPYARVLAPKAWHNMACDTPSWLPWQHHTRECPFHYNYLCRILYIPEKWKWTIFGLQERQHWLQPYPGGEPAKVQLEEKFSCLYVRNWYWFSPQMGQPAPSWCAPPTKTFSPAETRAPWRWWTWGWRRWLRWPRRPPGYALSRLTG